MNPSLIEIIGSVCFGLALIHSFFGHIELVFAAWAVVFVLARVVVEGFGPAWSSLQGLSFVEPLFVFAILCVALSKPILRLAEAALEGLGRRLPLSPALGFFVVVLTVGPLLGSFITEPAAMAVTAILLARRFYRFDVSPKLRYAVLGLLFVNISVGGAMTPFAAPPILMVAPAWGWDFLFMLKTFAWRAVLSCVLSTALVAYYFRAEFARMIIPDTPIERSPLWLVALHLLLLGGVILTAHHPIWFMSILVVFCVLYRATIKHQRDFAWQTALMVGLFLAGLVVLGAPQTWWLKPLLLSATPGLLFWGATVLTAITDNAALTYLGAQVPDLADLAKIALVSGAVVGGGLTVIANAPNPAGFRILAPYFGPRGIRPQLLLLGALPPTLIAAICFWLL